jgi:hypothetical protein
MLTSSVLICDVERVQMIHMLRAIPCQLGVVVRQIRESGFEDSNLFANFAGEREDSNP